jgi:hypothetical protein
MPGDGAWLFGIVGFVMARAMWLLALGGSCATATQATNPAPPNSGLLVVQPAPGPADNSRCFVCHANFDSEEEKLTLVHAQAGIGCVRCHGESSAHSTDEDGLTAPDRMFRKSRIRFNCLGCHDWVKLVASDKRRATLAQSSAIPDHQAVLDGTALDKKFCTDCHGAEHRLSHRTRIWDKETGKLLSKDATPRMLTVPSNPAR